jgi:hypothetical protein
MIKVGRGNLLTGGPTNAKPYKDRKKAAEKNARPSNRKITKIRVGRNFTPSQRTKRCEVTRSKVILAVSLALFSFVGYLFLTERSSRAEELRMVQLASKIFRDPKLVLGKV